MNPKVEEKKSHSVIDIEDDGDRSRNRENFCRICYDSSDISPLITLGCNCKGGVGFMHQICATTWFSFKGDNVCEICRKTAKNMIRYINNDNDINNAIENALIENMNRINIRDDDNIILNNANNVINNEIRININFDFVNARETRGVRIHGDVCLACQILLVISMFVAMIVFFVFVFRNSACLDGDSNECNARCKRSLFTNCNNS